MQKFLHILQEKSQKKIKNFVTKKLNSKWPLNSRWLPKLNLLVKTTNHLFSKKPFKAVFVAQIPKFYRKIFSQKFKIAPTFIMEIFFVIFF
jgi:hypothetical protein